jgi:hypothetical protein
MVFLTSKGILGAHEDPKKQILILPCMLRVYILQQMEF